MSKEIMNYDEDVKIIKSAILECQHKVVRQANGDQLSLYYGIGRYISFKTRKNAWGTNAIDTISDKLRKQLPGLRGFSATNMKYMRIFYETWCETVNRQPSADDLENGTSGDLIPINLLNQNFIINDERIVENSIVHNLKNFFMTFGQDFTFIGNQYRIESLGKEHFIDLLFYNRELSSLVAVELKKGEFKPSYLGQMNIYLQLLDDFVKKPNENPSIGIILCRSADKTYVEYAVRDYSKPMGVATYKTLSDMPEKLRKALPSIKEIEKELEAK